MKMKNVLALALLAVLTASNVCNASYIHENDLIPGTDIVIQEGDWINHLGLCTPPWQPIRADIFGGEVRILDVIFSNEANISGGRVRNVFLGNSATVNLYGGQIDNMVAADETVVNVFGYDLASANTGGRYDDGWISGFWEDETPFSIDLYHSNTYSHIVLYDTAIPEPATVLLLGLGALALVRKRRE